MQHHDQVAELRGLHTERANYLAAGRTERAEQVAHQIAGVTTALADRIKQLQERAGINAAQGADVRAGEATELARELQAVLDELSPPADQEQQEAIVDEPAPAPPAEETTRESAPRETATTTRRAGGRSNKES